MHRLLGALLGACLLACGLMGAAHATPALYVYRWAGCTGVANLPQFEAMLGRKVDGVVDFNDYTQAPGNAASNADWDLGCWQGHAANIIYKVGLSFSGANIAAVGAGAADATFTHIGQSLVSHGFPKAYVPLGWEQNGGWYGWGQKGAAFPVAFARASKLIKAACPGCTIVLNPSSGLDPTGGPGNPMVPPASSFGVVGLDDYINSWNSGGAATEPGLVAGDLNGYWGFVSGFVGSRGWYASQGSGPIIPELGVGSRGDGHGACTGTAWNSCDDAYGLAQTLSAAAAGKVAAIGYWDVNAGDYNSEVSGGERPGEAGVLIQTFGGANTKAILSAHASAFTAGALPTVTCTGCHATVIQNGPGHYDIVAWSGSAASATISWSGKTSIANLYQPASGTGVARALGAASSVSYSFAGGDQVIVGVQQ